MKIIATIAMNNDFKDDTYVLCEGLEKEGHIVERMVLELSEFNYKISYKLNIDKLKEFDVIWSPYEREIGEALILQKQVEKVGKKIPVVGHYEWAPPWRIGLENPANWGVRPEDLNNLKKAQKAFRNYYKMLIPSYLKCDLKTGVDKYSIDTIRYLTDEKIENVEIKPYVVDDEYLLNYKDTKIEKKYQITSMARLVCNKRIPHVVKALGMLKNPPSYKVLGMGPDGKIIRQLATKYGIKLEFGGYGQLGQKAIVIQESLLSINPWASIPVGEASVFKVPSIVYDHPSIRQKQGNIPAKYVPNNDIKALSQAIQYYLDNPKEREKAGKKAHREFYAGNAEIYPQKLATEKLVKILETAIGDTNK